MISNHPYEQKMAASNYYLNILITLPITGKSKQDEWKTILAIGKSIGYPIDMIHNLKTRLIKGNASKNNNRKKWSHARNG
jgi:hypothetical protein